MNAADRGAKCIGLCSDLESDHWHATAIERVEAELAAARLAANRVLAAEGAYRDARNGQGHPGEEHDDVLHDHGLCTPEYEVLSSSTDCALCAGQCYGSEDSLSRAYGDLRQVLGLPRMAWEGEDDPALAQHAAEVPA